MTAYAGDWPKRRARFLARHPTCVDCAAPATVPDHTPPRRLLVALGIHDPDHEQWLVPRCQHCHDSKTARVDKPLLNRWHAGEDATALAEEAMRQEGVGRDTYSPRSQSVSADDFAVCKPDTSGGARG